MGRKRLLEISVESVEAASAAVRGGADRIELCSNLSVGGTTPNAEVMRAVRIQVRVPIFAMIRPRRCNFVYSNAEFERMQHDIETAKRLTMDGVVLGILKAEGHVDVERTRMLVELARPLPVTFHRAFDETCDLSASVEDVIETGATRLLTSGGASSALEGLSTLAELVVKADDRIIVVPGAGINASNIVRIAQETRAREFHSGLSSVLPYAHVDYLHFEAEVRRLATLLDDLAC
jgi:copper homeostasis protein